MRWQTEITLRGEGHQKGRRRLPHHLITERKMGIRVQRCAQQTLSVYLDGPSTSIFEGRRAEDEVFEMKELFRMVAEYPLCGICLIQDDRFQYVNPAMATMFGYTVEEVLQRCGRLDLVCPDDRPIVAENFRHRVEDEAEEAHYQSRALGKEDSVFLSTYRAVGLSTGAKLP